MLPFGLWQGVGTEWLAVPASAWAAFLFLGIICGGFGIIWWNEGVRLLGLARGVAYSYTIPLFAILISLILLGEAPGWVQVAGIAIVLLGIRLTRTT